MDFYMMEFVGKHFSDGHTAKLGFLRDLLEAPWEDVDHPSYRLSPSTIQIQLEHLLNYLSYH